MRLHKSQLFGTGLTHLKGHKVNLFVYMTSGLVTQTNHHTKFKIGLKISNNKRSKVKLPNKAKT